jgi:outer membrane protein OmpA-like peptidoglycan-associated protein
MRRSEIHAVEFDTASTETPQRGAKDVEVAVSDTSATAGFAPAATVALKPGAKKQSFTLARAAAGRWIKIVVRTNHGDADYSQLMEFRALGKPLSRLRADAVKTALVAGGIAADRMTTAGLGQTKPVASNDTEVGRAQNRRVEVAKK